MLIALGVILPNKVYANTTNPFEAQDKTYNEQLLLTKSTYIDAKPSIQAKKSEGLAVDAENRYLVKFGNDVSLEQINNLITGYSHKMIGKSSNRLFRIGINDIEGFKVIAKSIVQSIELDSKTKLGAFSNNPYRPSQWAINALSLPNEWGITKESSKSMIQSIKLDPKATLSAFPNDPGLSSQWAINAVSLPNAWDITKGSDDTYVAVIDSGVSRYHEDLANNKICKGWDMLSDDYVYGDTVGHGTEVTGVIAATPNNNIGVSGTCWNVAIVPIAVVHYDGTIYTSDTVSAIYLAADLGCKVINLSLGSSSYSASEDVAVQYATSKGSIVVASAGNDSNSTIEYPASFNNVISVGSINKYLTHSYFSNYNSYVDVSAPGEDILTTSDGYYGNSYSSVDGTSFSSPYVAGIAALAATVVPGITATQFKDAIMASSTDLGSSGRDNYYGFGLINAEKLLKYVTQGVFVSVTNVSLNKTNSTINVGANETLSTTIAPTNATNKAVTWQSSNTAVATVDSNGKLAGVSAGTTVITVTTVDGSKTATCTVTVSIPNILVTGVSLNKTNSSINTGDTDNLSFVVAPANATNKNVVWSSSNPTVAIVDQSGKVTGTGGGTAVITVTTVDKGQTATCTVNVKAVAIRPVRLAGDSAADTAVVIADQTSWNHTAILASSLSYGMVDALTAGPLSFYLKAPILLTGAGDSLDLATAAELGKLGVDKVYVTSGTYVIHQGIIDQMRNMGINVESLGGNDRFDTSVNIAKKMVSLGAVINKIAVVYAWNNQDALSIASIASAQSEPILLTNKDSIPDSVRSFIANNSIQSADVIGGTGVISEAIKTSLPNATRHAGYSAYDTNSQVIQDFANVLNFDQVYLANGVTGIDALSGAPLAAQTKSAIVLTDGITSVAGTFVKGKMTSNSVITALGGTSVVPASVLANMEN